MNFSKQFTPMDSNEVNFSKKSSNDLSPARENTRQIITRLKPSSSLRCRTGLLIVPPLELTSVAEWGASFGLDTIYYAQQLLEDLPGQTRFVSLSMDTEAERLHRIANHINGTPVLLISQFDLAVARLGTSERVVLWQHVLTRMTQTAHGLLLVMPPTPRLLPETRLLEELRNVGRIADI